MLVRVALICHCLGTSHISVLWLRIFESFHPAFVRDRIWDTAAEQCTASEKSIAYHFPLKYDRKLYRQNIDNLTLVLDRKLQTQPAIMTDVQDQVSLHILATGKICLHRLYMMRNQEVNKAALAFGLQLNYSYLAQPILRVIAA